LYPVLFFCASEKPSFWQEQTRRFQEWAAHVENAAGPTDKIETSVWASEPWRAAVLEVEVLAEALHRAGVASRPAAALRQEAMRRLLLRFGVHAGVPHRTSLPTSF
jgi:hypothetical protein